MTPAFRLSQTTAFGTHPSVLKVLTCAAGCAASLLPKSRLMPSMVQHGSDQRVFAMATLGQSGRRLSTHNSIDAERASA